MGVFPTSCSCSFLFGVKEKFCLFGQFSQFSFFFFFCENSVFLNSFVNSTCKYINTTQIRHIYDVIYPVNFIFIIFFKKILCHMIHTIQAVLTK